MSIIHQFSIDGQIVTVPEEELEEFYASMSERGITPEEVRTFETDDGETLDVPASDREEFERSFGERQIPIRNVQRIMMDDGKELNLGEEDIRQFVQARQTGMPMSRGLLANTGIPDWYGKSREDREALADKFAAMFPLDDGPKPDYLPRERNLGDAITDKLNDGSLESEMLVGGMKAAGRIAKNVASTVPIVADAVGNLTDTELTRPISGYAKRIAQGSRDFMDAIDTEAEPIVTGDPEMDEKLTSFRDTFGGTLEAVGGMTAKSLLGVVPAEIAALGVNKAFDVAKDAMNKGMPAQKAIAMGVADGLLEYGKNKVLFGGGQRAVVENGLKSALKGMLGAVGKYTAAAGVQNVIEQGAQTDENGNFKANPDLVETMKAMGEEAKDIALYEAVNRGAGLAASGVFDRGQRKAASDSLRAAQEREEAVAKEVAREEARTRYEANLSDETRSDIENRVNDMVKTGVIPSYRHAQEVERLAAEKLGGRERGESTESVEQAVMEAAQEVAERLATPERVTSAALERRQTEAQMRENEFKEARFEKELEDLLAKRHDNSSEKAAMDEADVAAREAETERRKADYEAALADYEAKLAKAEAVRKKGGKAELPEKPKEPAEETPVSASKEANEQSAATEAKPVETPSRAIDEELLEASKNDATLRRIDEAYKKAKTDAERNALQDQFKARVDELRGELEAKETVIESTVDKNTETNNLTPREKEDYESRYAKERADFDNKYPDLERKLADVNARIAANKKEMDDYEKSFSGTIDEFLKDERRNELATKFGDLLREKSGIESDLKEPETPHDRNVRENRSDINYVKYHISYLKQLKKNALKKGESSAVYDKDIAKYEEMLKTLKGDLDSRVSIVAIPIDPKVPDGRWKMVWNDEAQARNAVAASLYNTRGKDIKLADVSIEDLKKVRDQVYRTESASSVKDTSGLFESTLRGLDAEIAKRNEKPVIEADFTGNKTTRTYKAKGDDVVPNGMNTRLGLIREDVAAKIADIDPNIKIVGIDFHGSRLRGDNRKDSDLDAVVEFKGDWSESSVFDALHGKDILTIDGVKVDINPIRADKTGNLEDYMRQSRQYDFSKEFEKGAVGVGEGTKKSDLSKKTAQVGKGTGENAEIGATKAWKGGEIDKPISEMSIEELRKAHSEAREKRIEANHAQSKLRDRSIAGDDPTNAEIEEADAEAGKWFRIEEETLQRLGELQKPKPTNVPDGRGRMVEKTENTAQKAKAEGGQKRTAATSDELKSLKDAIAEAKKISVEKPRSGTSTPTKTFEAKVGTTTIKFGNTAEGIAAAEKMAKKLSVVKDWMPKDPSNKTPSAPKPLKVARGKNIGTFDDVAPDFLAGKKDWRKDLKAPFVKDGYIYATDGRTLIRMKADVSAKNTEGALDAKKVFDDNVGNPVEKFKIDASAEIVPLEQARAATNKDFKGVEIWRSPDGKIVMRSRTAEDTSESNSAFMNASSLKGHDYLGTFDPDYIDKAFRAFAKLGVKDVNVEWRGATKPLYIHGGGAEVLIMPLRIGENGVLSADTKVQLLGGRRRMTDAQRAEAVNQQIADEIALAKEKNPKITQKQIGEIEERIREAEKKAQGEIEKHKGKLDPMLQISDTTTAQKLADTISMRRLDPKLRSDPKAIAWAQKRGFSVVDGKITPEARRAYDEDVTKKTASLSKRWFPDMKVVQHKHGEQIEHGQEVIDLRDTSGNTLGWFNPSNKEVHLLPGANAETVAHEIMWHGTRDWATTEAAKGNEAAKKLLKTMKDVEQNVPDALKNKVTRLYRANGVSSADVLFNEWGAWFTMGKGGKELESAMETAEGRKWYAKALSTVKDAYKDFLTAHGGNRADLAEIDGMTRDEFVDWLSKNFAGGKTLGEIGTPKDTSLSTEETLTQKARRIAYDSVAPVRDLEREIEKNTGVKIKAEDSVDAALALRPGEHEAVAINQKRQLREVKDMLKKYGLSSEDLGYYMALKAAPGRDAKIDAKNLAKVEADVEREVRAEWGSKKIEKDEDAFKAEIKRRFDEQKKSYVSTNGSAVDPREVAKMIPEIENGSKSIEYGAARDKIREIQEDTMDALIEAGLISKSDAEKLRKDEPDYVPFKSEFDPETGEFVGRAYNNLAEKTFYEAKGRQSSAGDILAHILNDNAMAHNKAIENKAREKLAKLVEAHPELGTVSALGNRNLTEARRKQGGNANVILFKREGKTMAIELNGSRGKAIAAAFTGVNQAKMPGWVQKASRAWAATATEISPTFAIRNVTKDNIELAQNAIKEMGYVKGTKFIGKYVANQVKSSAALAKYVTTGKIDTSSTTGKMLQDFIDAGGMIGGYGTEGYTDISRALSSEQIAKEMKRGTSAAKALAKHTLHSIEYLNKMSEMTSRFNAYRTQREMGMSAKEAALWSRRTLTDFNRKGDMTGVTNVLRMFSNSTLGANAKAATGLVTTKGGLALSAGLLANGAAQALIEHMVNADDDKKNAELGTGTGKDVSEYDRKSSFWLYRNAKTGKITKVGSHNGPFQLINYIGNCAMRVALGDMTAKDMAKELGMSAVELASAFSGWGEVNIDSQEDGAVGAIKAFAASVVPSAAQVIVEPALNTDYAGRNVYTEKGQSEKKPYYLRARKNTPEWAKNVSEAMNSVTGGNEARSGGVDVPAEVIQKVAESFGKNAAKDVITAYETGKALINGNYGDLESRMVPVKRDFVRDAPDSTSRYFNAKRDFEKDAAEFTGLRKTMSADERKQYIDEHPWVFRMDAIRKAINDIDDLRKYEAGFVKNGRGYSKRNDEPPKELVEKWKAKRLQLQAKILELMGR